jgi:hypothetical protein
MFFIAVTGWINRIEKLVKKYHSLRIIGGK